MLLITPLIELGSPQLDYVRAARALGVRSALCVWSWDHLSSKALIRVLPDAVIVWNEMQRDEAAALSRHRRPTRRRHRRAVLRPVVRSRAVARAAAAFCRRAGLPDAGRSSSTSARRCSRGSPSEARVRRAVGRRRSAPRPTARCATISILVRPHPQRPEDWHERRGADARGVAVWGSNPVDAESRADYFDSLFHSAGGRRAEHERAGRGRDRRSPGAHDAAAGVPRQPGRHVPLPSPDDGGRRLSERGAHARRARGAAGAARRRPGAAPQSRRSSQRSSVRAASTSPATPVVRRRRSRSWRAAGAGGRGSRPGWVLSAAAGGVRSGAGRAPARGSSALYWNPDTSSDRQRAHRATA